MKTALTSLVILAALAANTAHAGSMAPAPRVIAKYERDFMVRSGAQTLQELLDTGIVRYFLTGGQPLLVLVNGRPYASTAGGLDTLPLSAIERIELLSGDSLGTLDGSAVRGALNVVLRDDLDGFEARALTRLPSREGRRRLAGQRLLGRSGRRERAPERRRGRARSPGDHRAEPGVQPLRVAGGRRFQRGAEHQRRRQHGLGHPAQ